MASSEGPPTVRRRRASMDHPPTLSVEDTSLRIVVFGNSGPHQFSLTESIMEKDVFSGADPDTLLTTETSGSVLERDVVLVNTPNLSNQSLSHNTLRKEFRKCVCFSCPGPNVILFTLHTSEKPSTAYEKFKPVVQYFGESVLNQALVVLYHEGQLPDSEFETEVKALLKKCGQKFFIFDGRRNRGEGSVTRLLFDKIDKMISEHEIFSNQEFEDADKRIKKEEKYLEKKREKEVRGMLEALRKRHSGKDLEKEVELFHKRVHLENRERAEVEIAERLGFTLRLVDYAAAIGKGAFIGAVLGFAVGIEGVAIGATAGAALGGVLGGSVRALWNFFTGVFGEAYRDHA